MLNAKFFILLSFLNSNNKVSTLNRRFSDIKSFFIYLESINVISIKEVTIDTIENYIKTKDNCSAKTKSIKRSELNAN
jgi:site-specific recombinase XerD